MSDAHSKPPLGPRDSLTRKGEDEEEPEGKPTLGARVNKMTSRQERIVQALDRLDDEKLRQLTERIGADELAVALIDAGPEIKTRIAGLIAEDKLALFKEYCQLGRDKLPGDLIDGVQGKLLRLA